MKTDNTTLEKLTRGEEEVMQILWQLGAGSINDLIAAMQEPKPKYTTVATFLKILENKGYVEHEAGGGKSYEYRPIVPKEEYAHSVMSGLLSSYFGGSLAQMVSFFSRREDLSIQETEQILAIIRQARHKTDKS